MNIHARAEAAERIARKAGEMLLHHGKLKVRAKADNDFVTEMDVKSENMIREALIGQFPEDEFFGEEGGGASVSKGRWIVDPIDGTQSFMRGQHGYGISIAYEFEGELVMGCFYMPSLDEMFLAVRGEGATLNGEPIHVSDINNPREGILHLGFGHRVPEDLAHTLRLFPDIIRQISDVRRPGSAACDLCYIACGRADMSFELGLHIYDVAAGAVILTEAGGKISGWLPGEDFKVTGNVVASNGRLHDFIVAQLQG